MTTKPKYQNLKNIPTVKIVEILNSAPYYVTDKGTDYGPVKDELERILWERQGKHDERAMRAIVSDERANGAVRALVQVQDAKDILPETPVVALGILDRTELICEILESWKVVSENGFGFSIVAIPPRIMNF